MGAISTFLNISSYSFIMKVILSSVNMALIRNQYWGSSRKVEKALQF